MARGRKKGVQPQPARESGYQTKGEYVESELAAGRGRRRNRSMIQDVCDFCKGYRLVKRNQLALRLKGKKFMCLACRQKPQNKEIVENERPLPMWYQQKDNPTRPAKKFT